MPSVDLAPIGIPPATILREVRSSRMRPFGPVSSGIDKQVQTGRLYVAKLGLPEDEHDLTFHGGVDKALHQYCSSHYPFWRDRFTDESTKSRFVPGGFGENLVADTFDETNVCIGDLVRIGPSGTSSTDTPSGCILEVSLPRQPCFKLNQRFGVKNFAPQTHQHAKTGWYYRVVEEGYIEAGMEMCVVRRDHAKWSIARLHHYLHRDTTDMDITKELSSIDVMGNECKAIFKKRMVQHEERIKAKARGPGRLFRVAEHTPETPRVVRLRLEAVEPSEAKTGIPFGNYAVLKLPNGLKRAYSIVGGDTDCFTLGVARDDKSRGGSTFIHDKLSVGCTLRVSDIVGSIEPNGMASHYIFVVGGIGITAFLAMMQTVVAINQTFELHYAVRMADDVAFRSILSGFGSSVQIYDRSKGERMDIDRILKGRIWNSQVFTCGPQRMIDGVVKAAASTGMTEDEVHYEIFGADTGGDPFSVEVFTKGKSIGLTVESESTLLGALRAVGLEVGSSCEAGNCGTCRIPIKCGRVEHRGTGLTKDEQEKEMLSCVSRGIGHIAVEIPDV